MFDGSEVVHFDSFGSAWRLLPDEAALALVPGSRRCPASKMEGGSLPFPESPLKRGGGLNMNRVRTYDVYVPQMRKVLLETKQQQKRVPCSDVLQGKKRGAQRSPDRLTHNKSGREAEERDPGTTTDPLFCGVSGMVQSSINFAGFLALFPCKQESKSKVPCLTDDTAIFVKGIFYWGGKRAALCLP